MQLAGLSGFPYWGHDAGGFQNEETGGPAKNMYRQWSMAFGSFTPYWRPHGTGKSRWPLDRTSEEQGDAKVYCSLRYEMMPYIYTYAYKAYGTGMPMARAMVLYYQNDSSAWKFDSQYYWGDEILAAPVSADSGYVSVWLPPGNYYDFWNNQLYQGNRVIRYFASTGKLPLFIKEGAVIPMCDFALSTSFINKEKLNIHIYTGADGSFTLYEDDGETELYKTNNQKRFTRLSYSDSEKIFIINESEGSYENAPGKRAYKIIFHGLKEKYSPETNGTRIPLSGSVEEAGTKQGSFINLDEKTLTIFKIYPVNQKLTIKLILNK
jgi:alpha-D-xyloside xylohydrolase